MTPRGALYLLLTILTLDGSQCNTRYFVKMRTNASDMFKTKADNLRILQDPIAITPNSLYDNAETEHQVEDDRITKEISDDQYNRRNSFVETSTFNPDVLNKFLEDYANKIKSTTEKTFKYPFRIIKPPAEPLVLEIDNVEATTVREQDEKSDENSNATSIENVALSEALNDTLKRNKYYGTNTYEDRNGWVTLEAIPWSKSKISKWQANPSTQRPWPEIKPWDKPSMKPWPSDYTIRPTYENNKPWYDKPKPSWSDNNENQYQKPISRPPYHSDDIAQKWPLEKPYWNKYEAQSHRPNSDIITDNRPANFPNAWSRPQPQTASYQLIDKYTEKDQSGDGSNWHDYPSKYEQDRPRPSLITERPNFSHYQYVNNHPPNHPASGDGQWILLSTNRGYSKSRQRSIKIDTVNIPSETIKGTNMTSRGNVNRQDKPMLPVITSKRQVRLTVLPSINGTNTTTSHGGLLEVEKTFKSVEQSRKEYEMGKLTTEANVPNKRPTRNTLSEMSSSAVLAAVGAGIVPATMAMVLPMVLGRRKRDLRLMDQRLSKSYDPQMDLRKLAREYNSQQRRPIGL